MHSSPDPISEQLEALRREVEGLRAAQQQRRVGRRRWLVLGALGLAGAALAQPVITSFQPDAPALASAVNGNFTQVAAFTVPPGAVMFFDTAACPTGWSSMAAAVGRTIVGKPAGGTLRRTFGTAVTGDTEPVHSHTTNNAGSHSHTGRTTDWAGWLQTTINYNAVPGYTSPYHIVSNLQVDANGDHSHSVNGVGAGAVVPYLYLTACRKD